MYSKEPAFQDTGLSSPITQIALALVASTPEGEHFASGTAVIIAPFIAITAKHVIDDFAQKYDHIRLERPTDLSFYLQAFQIVGADINLWQVQRLWLSHDTDVAFIRLTPASESATTYAWGKAGIDLMPPAVGDRVVAFGYPGSEISYPKKENGGVQVFASPKTAVGEVLEVHYTYRDKAMLPFPCFRTNARFDGGMSGGPVVNDQGKVIGIVCSNIPPENPGDEHCSYVSLLWSSMATLIDMPRQGHEPDAYYPVHELAVAGFISASGLENVTLHDNPQSTIQVRLHVP